MSMQRSIIRVLIVDDHYVVRKGLLSLLADDDDIVVAGEANNGREAVAMTVDMEPDVILMDLTMPEMSGLEATQAILATHPEGRILILSGSASEEEILAGVRAGALGYVSKDCPRETLVDAIRRLHRGELSLPAGIARRMMQQFDNTESAEDLLTRRELDVLRQVARGHEDHQIAACLCISKATVRTHVSNCLAKLGLRNRVEATLYALRQGLAPLDPPESGAEPMLAKCRRGSSVVDPS